MLPDTTTFMSKTTRIIPLEAVPVATGIPRPGNCSTAVAMGLTDVQAAQWSHLDRDDDGVACYGD